MKEILEILGYVFYAHNKTNGTYYFRKRVNKYYMHIVTDTNYTTIKKYYIPNNLQHNLGIHSIGELQYLITLIRLLDDDVKLIKGM